MSKLHITVEAVTARIIERSKPGRQAYLDLIAKQRDAGVNRPTLSCGNLAHGFAASGEDIPMEKRALYAYQSSMVVRRLAGLVDDMVQQLGGRAIYTSSAIIQPWLDLNAARAHVANDPANRTGDVVGTMLGEPPAFNFL